MLKDVGLKENVYHQYPHQLSGGMQQRVMIAMALINSPALLVADEPTTALDVTTAHGIIELLKEMTAGYGLSVLFITHDISLAARFAQKIAVMYAGKVVEFAPAKEVYGSPRHPYTERLISCLPERYRKGERIKTIEGQVPDFSALPQGCAFHPRCPYRMGICMLKDPGETVREDSIVRCFKYGNAVEGE
jgi:oligopeptide/dipeptide ABC transporter ATP-binding protein